VGGDGVAPDVDAPRDGLLGAHRRVVGAAHGRLWLRGMWGGVAPRRGEGRKQRSRWGQAAARVVEKPGDLW
jgi:hypothetical protein